MKCIYVYKYSSNISRIIIKLHLIYCKINFIFNKKSTYKLYNKVINLL